MNAVKSSGRASHSERIDHRRDVARERRRRAESCTDTDDKGVRNEAYTPGV